MQAHALEGGFTDAPIDAARAFRGLMTAMARPGTICDVSGATPPAPLGAAAGTAITLSGNNFSPTPDHNVVLFSGIRGRVTSASSTELEVLVPVCLPTRSVQVTAQLGAVKSEALALEVTGASDATVLSVGEVVDMADDSSFPCLRLSGLGGASYLVQAMSASTIGGAQHDFEVTGLVGDASPQAQRQAGAQATLEVAGGVSPQARFEELLRRSEAVLVREGVARRQTGPLRVEGAVPSVGHTRTFQVFNADSEFDEVNAVAKYVGARAALYVDEKAPGGGLSTSDLADFGRRFDEVIYPTVRNAFGDESDLDGNQRVVILFTPTVNSLTPRGSTGFVGGFYYGIDLLPDREGSNNGEIFYSLVPDPAGEFSDARPKQNVLEVTPAVLAHEFQHMVHFNERVLVLEAASTEALWLSEGLAQMAEELVAAGTWPTRPRRACSWGRVVEGRLRSEVWGGCTSCISPRRRESAFSGSSRARPPPGRTMSRLVLASHGKNCSQTGGQRSIWMARTVWRADSRIRDWICVNSSPTILP